jgi:hypothetical protein
MVKGKTLLPAGLLAEVANWLKNTCPAGVDAEFCPGGCWRKKSISAISSGGAGKPPNLSSSTAVTSGPTL